MLLKPTTTEKENWIEALGIKRSKIPVLIIGNNPIEMTSIYNILMGIRSKKYLADVCFNVKDSLERIIKTKPEVVFIDDNLILDDIQKLIRVLKQNAKTKLIKLIALKSSNWSYHIIDKADDYILKDTIVADVLDRVITKNLNPIVPQPA
jgi:chemotaxis response regulator CheB